MQMLPWLRELLASRWPQFAGFGFFFLLGIFLFFPDQWAHSGAQPIAFNHAKHIQNQMACTDCHAGVQTQARATLPSLATCLLCHEAALTKSGEEAKIRTLAAAGKEPAWVQVTRMPAHVYFSHRRHVQLARLACATCHGPMEKATAPPSRPYLQMTMDGCIRCHQNSKARTDCNDCHR